MDEKKRSDAERALEYTIAHAVAESGLTMEEAIGSMSRVQEHFRREKDHANTTDVRMAAGARYHFSVEESNAAKQIVEYMQRYQYHKARDLYAAIELTMKFISDLKKAGVTDEKAWEIISLAATMDCHRRD